MRAGDFAGALEEFTLALQLQGKLKEQDQKAALIALIEVKKRSF
jgi:hypothetical protein